MRDLLRSNMVSEQGRSWNSGAGWLCASGKHLPEVRKQKWVVSPTNLPLLMKSKQCSTVLRYGEERIREQSRREELKRQSDKVENTVKAGQGMREELLGKGESKANCVKAVSFLIRANRLQVLCKEFCSVRNVPACKFNTFVLGGEGMEHNLPLVSKQICIKYTVIHTFWLTKICLDVAPALPCSDFARDTRTTH